MPLTVAVVCVVLLNLYAVVLILLRGRVYRQRVYRPMLWNIWLSSVPVIGAVIAAIGFLFFPLLQQVVDAPAVVASAALWVYLILGTGLWLLFFPNSIYLITELNFSHRRSDDDVPLWYDIVQTLTLTLSGIANAVLSLAMAQLGFIVIMVDPNGSEIPVSSWVFVAVVLLLGSIGVYLGRYLRLNSWDVRHPSSLIGKLRSHLATRGKALEACGFVLTHTILVALVYVPLFGLGYSAAVG